MQDTRNCEREKLVTHKASSFSSRCDFCASYICVRYIMYPYIHRLEKGIAAGGENGEAVLSLNNEVSYVDGVGQFKSKDYSTGAIPKQSSMFTIGAMPLRDESLRWVLYICGQYKEVKKGESHTII